MMTLDDAMTSTTDLKRYLDPTGVHVLKKRLRSGQITPTIFKQTLKRQMVSQFFMDYTHPVDRVWSKMATILRRERRLIDTRSQNNGGEPEAQPELGQPFPMPTSKKME
ncbi:hypothetical protein [Nitrospina watsonii]|uniref:Uncharacterized protein n=1 Tax=Nitrospina watsonii TaxID=1323948 RepID=A0ABM9HCC0_9BACT|nr:hypothetical protein [Nitrospina watsonii]CAI2717815.1 conserved protein of unknown function [Nitrospina watsonii]